MQRNPCAPFKRTLLTGATQEPVKLGTLTAQGLSQRWPQERKRGTQRDGSERGIEKEGTERERESRGRGVWERGEREREYAREGEIGREERK